MNPESLIAAPAQYRGPDSVAAFEKIGRLTRQDLEAHQRSLARPIRSPVPLKIARRISAGKTGRLTSESRFAGRQNFSHSVTGLLDLGALTAPAAPKRWALFNRLRPFRFRHS